MNSYSFGINGEIWLLVILIVFGLAVSLWTYFRTNPELNPLKKILLISLRSIALILLIIILFEPLLEQVSGKKIKPKIAVLFDNSTSMSVTDAAGDRTEKYYQAIENSQILNNADSDFYVFSNQLENKKEFNKDSLDFSGSNTDIATSIREIKNKIEEQNYKAVLLFSDGRFNEGENPIYELEGSQIPIFTIGIGDTNQPKDISINNVITNDATFNDNPIPVNVNFSVKGIEDTTLKINFYDNSEKIEEREIELFENMENYSLLFTYNPKVEGTRKLSFEIPGLESEITLKNNSQSKFIKVLDNKRKIALFSGYPNPDLSFIRKWLEKDKSIEVMEFIQKNDSDFYIEPNENLLNQAEMFVFVAFPISTTPSYIVDLLDKQLSKGKPLFFMAGLKTDYYRAKPIEKYLPFNIASSREKEFLTTLYVTPTQINNPLYKIDGVSSDAAEWNNLPPIFKTETFVKVKPESEVLSFLKINNVDLQEPLIMSREFQGQKSLALMGYGLYRWKMIGYASDQAKGRYETKDLYSSFLDNSFKWLSLNKVEKKVKIKTTKDFYNENEEVEFIANVVDNTYNAIDNAIVNVNITSGDKKRQVSLNPIGNGRYYGKVKGLSSGDYNYFGEANTSLGKIGEDSGRFNIGEQSIEYLDLTQNKELLQLLADRSGGKYYNFENTTNSLNDIINNSNYKERAVTLKSEFSFWNLPILLAIAIGLFATEWFIRKRSGLL